MGNPHIELRQRNSYTKVRLLNIKGSVSARQKRNYDYAPIPCSRVSLPYKPTYPLLSSVLIEGERDLLRNSSLNSISRTGTPKSSTWHAKPSQRRNPSSSFDWTTRKVYAKKPVFLYLPYCPYLASDWRSNLEGHWKPLLPILNPLSGGGLLTLALSRFTRLFFFPLPW